MCVKVTSKGVKHLAEFSDGSLRSLGLGHCTGVDVSVATNMHKLFCSLTYLDLRYTNIIIIQIQGMLSCVAYVYRSQACTRHDIHSDGIVLVNKLILILGNFISF